jgi:hypothetical protein
MQAFAELEARAQLRIQLSEKNEADYLWLRNCSSAGRSQAPKLAAVS